MLIIEQLYINVSHTIRMEKKTINFPFYFLFLAKFFKLNYVEKGKKIVVLKKRQGWREGLVNILRGLEWGGGLFSRLLQRGT